MHNIKIKYGFIQGITRSGISHAREGENPLSHAKTDVWRLTHLHEAGRLDRLSVSSTHSYMMKTNRGMFPGQRREMEFPDLHARRICQGGSGSCQASAQLWVHWGGGGGTLSAEEHQSQHHSLLKNNHPAAVSPVFNWWRIDQYYIPTLLKWHLFSRVSKCHKQCLKLCLVLPIY